MSNYKLPVDWGFNANLSNFQISGLVTANETGNAIFPISVAPAAATGTNGEIQFDDTNNIMYRHNGSSWVKYYSTTDVPLIQGANTIVGNEVTFTGNSNSFVFDVSPSGLKYTYESNISSFIASSSALEYNNPTLDFKLIDGIAVSTSDFTFLINSDNFSYINTKNSSTFMCSQSEFAVGVGLSVFVITSSTAQLLVGNPNLGTSTSKMVIDSTGLSTTFNTKTNKQICHFSNSFISAYNTNIFSSGVADTNYSYNMTLMPSSVTSDQTISCNYYANLLDSNNMVIATNGTYGLKTNSSGNLDILWGTNKLEITPTSAALTSSFSCDNGKITTNGSGAITSVSNTSNFAILNGKTTAANNVLLQIGDPLPDNNNAMVTINASSGTNWPLVIMDKSANTLMSLDSFGVLTASKAMVSGGFFGSDNSAAVFPHGFHSDNNNIKTDGNGNLNVVGLTIGNNAVISEKDADARYFMLDGSNYLITSDSFTLLKSSENNTGIEIGAPAMKSYIDFHSFGTAGWNDYDARIICFGGTSDSGNGSLEFISTSTILQSAQTSISGTLSVSGITKLDNGKITTDGFGNITVSSGSINTGNLVDIITGPGAEIITGNGGNITCPSGTISGENIKANTTLTIPSGTYANLTSSPSIGMIYLVTNACKPGETSGSGTGVLCVYDGSNWMNISSGTTVTI